MSAIEKLIGNTPLVKLLNFASEYGITANLYAKCEGFNPVGSAKDRVAAAMILGAERRGVLKAGGVIIEPTSGNTGIALAAIGRARGYRVILTMPDTMSAERVSLIKAYGGEVVLTAGDEGMAGAAERAEELKKELGGVILGQFSNPDNAAAHYNTTGPEIYNALGGKIDIFVAGVGTGGTITGVGKFLKNSIRSIKIVAVEPASSPVLSGGRAGAHKIQGIGAGFIPEVLDRSLLDEVITVSDGEATAAAKKLALCEGLLAGISSGAALCAAVAVASRAQNAQKNIVVLLPDSGERYLSCGIF